jgi:hypothetical protein
MTLRIRNDKPQIMVMLLEQLDKNLEALACHSTKLETKKDNLFNSKLRCLSYLN